MRSHHAKAVKQLLDSSKVTYLYLPPYSPDLNPIKKMWSKLKAFLRKEKIRMASKLPSAISKGFLTIRPKGECNRNCVSFSNLLSRFYQMPELSVKAGTLTLTGIPAFKAR